MGRMHGNRKVSALLALLCPLLLAACLESQVARCRDGSLCPREMACDDAHRGCVLPVQLETCEGMADGTPCSFAGTENGACYERVCLARGCGNWRKDDDELCDDGNRVHGDGCSADCQSDESCGNGKLDVTVGESCDTAGDGDANLCRDNCVSMLCGDGTVDESAFEQCDEGQMLNSRDPNAACRPDCRRRRCGDGVRDDAHGEVCDDGNGDGNDGCSADCKSRETCGNGTVDVQAGESCEPDGPDDKWCRPDCSSVRCGDGIPDHAAGEQCDLGERNSEAPNAACRPDCQEQRCGDGATDDGETCDDGNHENGDGCSYDCASEELCGNGYRDLDRGEECDDHNFMSHDGCSSRCRLETPRWHKLAPAEWPRHTYSVIYDARRDAVMHFDGHDVWELRGRGWQKAQVSGTRPRAGFGHSLVWDRARGDVLLFGGTTHLLSAILNETWLWDGARWRQVARDAAPTARTGAAIVYDAARERVLLFGGRGADDVLSDTWEWDGQRWTEVVTASAPPAGEHQMVYDPVRGEVLLFDEVDLWRFASGTWELLPTVAKGLDLRGWEWSLTYDPQQQRVLLFDDRRTWARVGSTWLSLDTETQFTREVKASDMIFASASRRLLLVDKSGQVWDWDGQAWSMRAMPSTVPVGRNGHAMAYDPRSGSTLLFGGDSADETLGDTWVWGSVGFEQRHPALSPPARWGHALVHDARSGQLLLFGGGERDGTLLDDTWSWDGETWHLRAIAGAPPARTNHAMAYDRAHERVVLFGGSDGAGEAIPGTWHYQDGSWTPVSVGESPTARHSHAMAYDPVRARTVMFGGLDATLSDELSYTWEWDGTAWERATSDGPERRDLLAMAYDPRRRRTLMLGGYYESAPAWEFPARDGALHWEQLPYGREDVPFVQGPTLVYDSAVGRMLAWASTRDAELWELAYRAPGEPDESCRFGFDTDHDGLVGCDDPDCAGYCTPLCLTGGPCAAELPQCGDGVCNAQLETCRMCPGDCACESLCGDFFCDPGEVASTCPGDCH
jgi:cysteine-rich repeat protein